MRKMIFMNQIASYQKEILEKLAQARDLTQLEQLRLDVLGKKGSLTTWMKELGGLESEARRVRGEALNLFKEIFLQALEHQKNQFEHQQLSKQLASETLDITLPCAPERAGRLHPLSMVLEEVIHIFGQMGFSVEEGPDIEDDFHNFTALNIPPNHPARAEQDTFYLPNSTAGENLVLRTHTSPVQIRTMMSQKPPLRMIVPGRVYRSDYDQTHTPMFHQIEGLVIDDAIHMGHLKGCLAEFCRLFFEKETLKVRFRPGFFPFTEPSAEVDIGCHRQGPQLKIGEGSDWLEILGCGMVHPNVLRNCGLDPEKTQGFAFGMGLERIAMLKYGIPDLRSFFENDQRWLSHYGFLAADGRI